MSQDTVTIEHLLTVIDGLEAEKADLLGALEDGINTRMDTEHGAHRWKLRARTAIAKAKGEA